MKPTCLYSSQQCSEKASSLSDVYDPNLMADWLVDEYFTWSGRRRGLSDGRLGGSMLSSASSRVGPLYHGRLLDLSIMLSPWNPEIGTKATCKQQFISMSITLSLNMPALDRKTTCTQKLMCLQACATQAQSHGMQPSPWQPTGQPLELVREF